MASTTTDQRFGVNIGKSLKVPCAAASTANLTLSGEQTVDGVDLVTGQRILCKNQTDASENGIYIVDTGDWDRAPDWDGSYDVVTGTLVSVVGGTVNALTMWYVATTGTITIGTTEVTISQYRVSAFTGSGGSGEPVTAATDLTDNRLVRADGTAGIQNSAWTAEDGGDLNAGGNAIKHWGEVIAATTASTAGTITPDYSAGNVFTHTLSANVTIAAPSNLASTDGSVASSWTFRLTQASTTAYTVTYSTAYSFVGGTVHTMSTGASARDWLSCVTLTGNPIDAFIAGQGLTRTT